MDDHTLNLPWPLEMLAGLTARQVADVLVCRGFVKMEPSRPGRGLEIVGTYVPLPKGGGR